MRTLSVFSGLGAFDYGVQNAGWEIAGQIEIDGFCQNVLAKHWPRVWKGRDVKGITGETIRRECGRVDAIIGGPPCQPASIAGGRRGADDPRWLWPDYLRLVSEVDPLCVLAENPRGVLSLKVEGIGFRPWIASQFQSLGYELWPVELAAEDLGAPHRRERVWFIALGRSAQSVGLANALRFPKCEQDDKASSVSRQDSWPHLIGRGDALELGDSHFARSQEHSRLRRDDEEEFAAPLGAGWRWPARPGEQQFDWEQPRVATKSALGAYVNGTSGNVARWRRCALQAIGNAVVPQCAQIIAEAINDLIGERTP